MGKRLGENIDSEWERDPYADRVWDALQLIKTQSEQGLAALLDLSAKGSSLALLFAAHQYRDGINNVLKNEGIAIGLLQQALDLGSIEAGYHLGFMHFASGRLSDGLETYQRLSDLGYSPAMYCLGYQYLHGDSPIRDIKRGEELWRQAARNGHFFAGIALANRLIKRKTVRGFMEGWIRKFALLIPFVRYRLNFRSSDRLRT